MFRFSLRWLLVFVAFIAVGLVSLRYASKPLSDCLSVVWIALLLVAIFGVAYRKERQRAFWFGCCVFGWSFAAYVHFIHGNTIFARANQSIYDSVKWSVPASREMQGFHRESGGMSERSGIAFKIFFPRFFPFISASRSLTGIILAILGGLTAQWFHATRD